MIETGEKKKESHDCGCSREGVRKVMIDTGEEKGGKSLCREGLFILPYNELAIAQGPKIYQKNEL